MDIAEVLAPVRDLGGFIRQQREAAQLSLRQLARQAGVSNPYLSQVERGLRRPSAEILAQIAHGLQISVESLLTMAGILQDPATGDPDRVDVPAAIGADPVLTPRQKASLLDIYHLYRRESERADHAADADSAQPPGVPTGPPTRPQTATPWQPPDPTPAQPPGVPTGPQTATPWQPPDSTPASYPAPPAPVPHPGTTREGVS